MVIDAEQTSKQLDTRKQHFNFQIIHQTDDYRVNDRESYNPTQLF